MSAHEILIAVMAVFAVLGAVDRIIGNKLGIGQEFENGILAMGSLALAMVGIIALAPVLAQLLQPVVVPVYRFFGADPAMFAGTILACDMGGGALAMQMTQDPQAALLGGVITGSMLGATIVFTIPVAMGILREEDRSAMAKGILCGIVTIPVGVLAGGLVAGYSGRMLINNLIPIIFIGILIAVGLWKEEDRPFLAKGILAGVVTIPVGLFVGGLVAGLSVLKVLGNLVPIVLIAGLIALGLWRAENAMIKGFGWFGKGVVAVITVGLAATILETLTGFSVFPGMTPIEESFQTVGAIAIVLAGAFPLVFVVTKLLRKPLLKLGGFLGINDTAAAGLVASLANSIATFGMVKDMDNRGKVVNIAFAVSAAFVFGDHLGFAAGFAPEILPAMIVGKLAGGVSAILVALLLTRKENGK